MRLRGCHTRHSDALAKWLQKQGCAPGWGQQPHALPAQNSALGVKLRRSLSVPKALPWGLLGIL